MAEAATPVKGTRPEGALTEADASSRVREMFTQIAPRYDLLNHLLSLQLDRLWRARVARRLRPILTRPDALARIFARKLSQPPTDFFEADALHLPFADASFDLVTSAFGFRNLANYEAGLREIYRVLKPGGTVAILEFMEPPEGILGDFYRWYFTKVLPRVGWWISGHQSAYTYLPKSVARFFLPRELATLLTSVGYESVVFEEWTMRTVALHTGVRPR